MADASGETFTFAQIRAILARQQAIHETKLKTFEARLQQLQKLGLPRGTNVGRYARARYAGWQLAELALYLDLLDAGVTPAALQARFAEQPFYMIGNDGPIAEREPRFVAFALNALTSMRVADPNRKGPHAVDHSTWAGPDPVELLKRTEQDPNTRSPIIVLNLTARLEQLRTTVAALVPAFAGKSLFPSVGGH